MRSLEHSTSLQTFIDHFLFWSLELKSTISVGKHHGGTVNSRQDQKQTQEAPSTPEISSEAKPIELMGTVGNEIMGLTCDSSEPKL
jgi:hypothetical protein